MQKSVCVTRQKQVRELDRAGKSLNPWSLEYCRDCDQGKGIVKEVSEQKPKGKEKTAMPVKPKEKVCADCGKLKSIDDFPRHCATKDGRMNICLKCMSKRNSKGQLKRYRDQNVREKANDQKFTVNLSDYPEILEPLQEAAHKRIRTPQQQILAYLVQGLKSDGYGMDEIRE